jgi:regulator of replication initiation timing
MNSLDDRATLRELVALRDAQWRMSREIVALRDTIAVLRSGANSLAVENAALKIDNEDLRRLSAQGRRRSPSSPT